MYDLVSIGSIVKDIIVLTDRGKIFKTPKDKLAPAWLGFELGEKIRAVSIVESLGGVATDLAIGTKRAGLNSSLISTIGSDFDWILKELGKNRIDGKYITIDRNRQTASVILVDGKSGERVILYNKSSGTINIKYLNTIKTKWLSVSSLTGKWRNQAKQIQSYISRKICGLILLPSTSQIRDDFTDLRKLLRISKILILNKNEALEIASQTKRNSTQMRNLIDLLHNLGPKVVCITDGRKGAWASNGKNIFHSPIKKVRTIDCTGAGDAFASGFLGVFLKNVGLDLASSRSGQPDDSSLLMKSLKAGIINSASVVQHIGTTNGLLTKNEILSKINLL